MDPSFTAMRSAEAIARGATRGQLRGPRWVTAGRGLVKPAGLDEDPTWARISVATGYMTPGCTLGGWASLRAQGNTWYEGNTGGQERPILVHCGPGARIRRRKDVLPFRGLLLPDEVIHLEHYDVTTMARAVFDEMRMAANVREAVIGLDMATSTTIELPHTTRLAVERVLTSHHKVRGLIQAKNAFALGSTRSASPWETRTRLLAELDAGIPPLAVNVPLFDPYGNLLGIADLLDEEAGLVLESDGAHHRDNVRHTDDNRREEKFERAGLVVGRITSLDHREKWRTVGRIAAARRDAQGSVRREWTTQKPDWWWAWAPGRRWD